MKYLIINVVSFLCILIVIAVADNKIEYGDDLLYKRLSIRGQENGKDLTEKRIREIICLPRCGPIVNFDSVYVMDAEWLSLEEHLQTAIIFKGYEKYGERIF